MFLLCADTSRVRRFTDCAGVGVDALAVAAPAVARPPQRPPGSIPSCALRCCHGGKAVHDRYTDEIVLFQPEYIVDAVAYAEVLPGYGLEPIPL